MKLDHFVFDMASILIIHYIIIKWLAVHIAAISWFILAWFKAVIKNNI